MSRIVLFYKANDEFKRYDNDLTSMEHDDFNIRVNSERQDAGTRFTITLIPRADLLIKKAKLIIPVFKGYNEMLVNGYQSWTTSRWMGKHEKIRGLNRAVGKLGLSAYGDYRFLKPLPRGKFTSHTYTGFRSSAGESIFFGSLNRENAMTFFAGDLIHQLVEVSADIPDLELDEPFTLFDIYRSEKSIGQAWEDYEVLYKGPRKPGQKKTGWTSWYQHYTNISEDIILENLKGFTSRNIPIDIFQIDDGYQKKVGDWLEIKPSFPRGMKPIADEIKKEKISPGLWLAPFICEKTSAVYREHPEWILRDHRGRPVTAGYNPGWSNHFYALDIYHDGVRDYLEEVFNTVVNDWGYELLKLDFLYAVCLHPPKGKTRGMVMNEAMELLHTWCGKAAILGCGVPLEYAFKRMEYCRIGSDVGPVWEDMKLKITGYRERVSTYNSLLSTFSRQYLDQRFFGNDPDVFYLRQENNDMSDEQNRTLSIANQVLGSVVFTSDSMDQYDAEQTDLYRQLFTKQSATDRIVRHDGNVFSVIYTLGQHRFQLYSNLGKEYHDIRPAEGEVFDSNKCRYVNLIRLKSYETRIVCLSGSREDVLFLGSCFNMPSLADVHIEIVGNTVTVRDERCLPVPIRLCFKSDVYNELIINEKIHKKENSGYFVYEITTE